jgi:hypothetical protein
MTAGPEAVFGTLTDIARLPHWKAGMTSIVEPRGRHLARRELPASLAALAAMTVATAHPGSTSSGNQR